jgi:hypothetical protein
MNNVQVQDLAVIRDRLMAYLILVSAINTSGYRGAVELGESIVEQLTALIEETE